MSVLTNLILLLVTSSLQLDFITAQNFGNCIAPNRERATCVQLDQCQYLYDLVQNPDITPADRTYLSRSQCGYVNNKVLVCCPDRFRNVGQPNTATQRMSVSQGNSLPEPPQCGTTLSNRIFGGNITAIDEFPWMALIEYTKPGNVKGHHCGGTLINNRYVLTAAHCVTGRGIPSSWRLSGVRLGEWDTTMNPDCEVDGRGKRDCAPEHMDITVEQSISHPQYNAAARSQVNDIALLRLSRTITFGDFVKPICLPSTANLRNDVFVGSAMDVAGWGKTESESTSSIKLKATVSVWNLAECRSTYTRQNIALESTQICAGGSEGVDSCRGDSGGPLMIQEKVSNRNIYFLVGVVSFGPTPCGLSGWPGVYTRVGAYIDWITNTVRT